MKIRILFISMLCNLLITATAKNVYTYNLVQTSPQTVIEEQKHYAYPGTSYKFIVNIANYNGFAIGKFKLELTNGRFSNDSVSMTVENGVLVTVNWNDTPNVNAGIKITSASVYDSQRDSLKAGVKQIMFYKIASLKGQTPVLTYSGNPNPAIGNKQQFTAMVNEMIYPGIVDTTFGVITNRKVKYFQWKLPDGWRTTNNQTGTFITSSGVRQIAVIPDYVNQGTITVRGVNDLYTGYSETTSFFADRGFSFTNYPTSITFGDNSVKNFSTSLFSGINYEWSAPTGWQINGQGNTLEALNLNSVNITPSFCTQTDGRVRLRLKKNGEISSWYDCTNYQGVQLPSITTNNSTIYQLEETTFSIGNTNMSNIQSISCSGNGIYYVGNQGSDFKVAALQSGTLTMNVSLLMSGCTTPVVIPKTISVQPHRFSINGVSPLCSQETFTINNSNKLPSTASIFWSKGDYISILSGQNTPSCSFQKTTGNGVSWIGATISIGGESIILPQKNVWVGLPATPSIIGPQHVDIWGMGSYSASGTNDPYTTYQWSVSPSTHTIYSSGANATIYFNAQSDYTITLSATNTCGTTTTNYYVATGELEPFSIYPNPATDLLTVNYNSATENNGGVENNENKFTIQLWNETNGLVKSIESNSSTKQISLRGLPKGMYSVHIVKKNKTIRKQLIWIK